MNVVGLFPFVVLDFGHFWSFHDVWKGFGFSGHALASIGHNRPATSGHASISEGHVRHSFAAGLTAGSKKRSYPSVLWGNWQVVQGWNQLKLDQARWNESGGDLCTRCRPEEMMRISEFDLADQGIGPAPHTSRSAKKLIAGKVSRECLGKAMSTVARQHPPPAFREGWRNGSQGRWISPSKVGKLLDCQMHFFPCHSHVRSPNNRFACVWASSRLICFWHGAPWASNMRPTVAGMRQTMRQTIRQIIRQTLRPTQVSSLSSDYQAPDWRRLWRTTFGGLDLGCGGPWHWWVKWGRPGMSWWEIPKLFKMFGGFVSSVLYHLGILILGSRPQMPVGVAEAPLTAYRRQVQKVQPCPSGPTSPMDSPRKIDGLLTSQVRGVPYRSRVRRNAEAAIAERSPRVSSWYLAEVLISGTLDFRMLPCGNQTWQWKIHENPSFSFI